MSAPVPLRDLAPDDFMLHLDSTGAPDAALLLVALESPVPDARHLAHLTAAAAAGRRVAVGVSRGSVDGKFAEFTEALACTLAAHDRGMRSVVGCDDIDAAQAALAATVGSAPRAATTLLDVLGIVEHVPVTAGLAAESSAYSMLLAGPEFARWRAAHPARSLTEPPEPAVVVARNGTTLTITLNQPDRRNAYSRHLRDALVEALELVLLDESITCAELRGAGPAFCSGGDLDEFGTTTDVTAAHQIRLERSAAARLARCADRVRVVLHGACIGAGVELPSFAGHVEATADAFFQLPELAMGLIPGAGGTVGITRRVGRWRTAYLALSGAPIDAAVAQRWGLVDARA